MSEDVSETITAETKEWWRILTALEAFPCLTEENSKPTSRANLQYNCIAWAAEDTSFPWWPKRPEEEWRWPPSVPREESLDCFVQAFETLGYQTCDDGTYESEYQKVVIYVNDQGTPKHMARQLTTGPNKGWWTSKMGVRNIDICHRSVKDLEGEGYGKAKQYMRRPISSHSNPSET